MTILTLIKPLFKKQTKRIYGPQEIPPWHFLYGKKCWRCGHYERKLRLYDKSVIIVVVYRFYCPETRRTYSLLPFFISRYERHINTVLEDVLYGRLVDGLPIEKLSEEPAPSPWTVRRWIHKFGAILENSKQSVEIFLIRNIPDYHPATVSMSSHPFKTLLEKASHLEANQSHLSFFSPLSYIFYVNAM
ncbi:hypothetical protein [Dehalobacterium formicoaceticum]|uniref:hypothetical protein n=1 Tax=Dehalobacterium formicoaceticum TaxID=51515 RepID=UPI0012FC8C29|nr:hypothetical protein [Dehalobacterium formicoaceticum]